jgi:hypothetical protein
MAAIMVGDIVGYSAMMEKSEEKTVARLATCETLVSEKVASLDGKVSTGLATRHWRSFRAQSTRCDVRSRLAQRLQALTGPTTSC